jgi:uncharacterized membrane protein
MASEPPLHPHHAQPLSSGARLRAYFLTGVVIAGPVAITVYLTWWFISLVDGWVKPLIPAVYLPETYLPFAIPGFGLIVAFFGLTMLGFLTANLVGRTLFNAGERLLDSMPVVRGLYKSVKQIFETLFSQSGTSFRKLGLIEYPMKGMWSLVFISADPKGDIGAKLPHGHDYVGVFLPCAPNPTTGFFFYLPKQDVIELAIDADEGAKLVMSLGLIQPDEAAKLKAEAQKKALGKAKDQAPA